VSNTKEGWPVYSMGWLEFVGEREIQNPKLSPMCPKNVMPRVDLAKVSTFAHVQNVF